MATKKIEEIKEGLSCSICFSLFNKPKALPCLHTFCEKCISDHMNKTKSNGTFRCPLCNQIITVPSNGVAGLKDNFFINGLVDCFPAEDSVTCDLCTIMSRETLATSKCIQCLDNLCSTCAEGHTKTRQTINHKVVMLEDVKAGNYFEEMRSCRKQMCRSHTTKELEMFCEQCELPICVLCKAFEHDSHKVTNPESAVLRFDNEIRELLEDVLPISEFFVSCVTKLKQQSVMLDSERKRATRSIKEHFQKVRQSIDKEEAQLLSAVENKNDKLLKDIHEKLAGVEQNSDKLKTSIAYTQYLHDSGDTIEKLQQHNDLLKQLGGFKEQNFTCLLYEKPIYVLEGGKVPDNFMCMSLQFPVKKTKLELPTTGPAAKSETSPAKEVKNAWFIGKPSKLFKMASESQLNSMPNCLTRPSTSFTSVLSAGQQKITRFDLSRKGSQQSVTRLPKAEILTSFATRLEGETAQMCCDIQFNGHQNTYFVIDRENAKMKEFSENGQLQRSIDKLSYPMGVTCTDTGHIMITDDFPGFAVYKVNFKKERIIQKNSLFLGGIDCDNKRIVTAGGGKLVIMDMNGGIKTIANKKTLGLSSFMPFYVAFAPNGNIICTD